MTPQTRAFWRTDGTYATRTAAECRARAVRWSPIAVRVAQIGLTYAVQVGANDARLLRKDGQR